jgi:hypothetical protein
MNAFLSFGLISLLITLSILYVLFVVPVASVYLQQVLLETSAQRYLYLIISLGVVAVGTFAVYFALKIVLWQHRISQR